MRRLTFGQLTQIGRRLIGRTSRPVDPAQQIRLVLPAGGCAVFTYCRATSRNGNAVYRSSNPIAAGFEIHIEQE